MNLLMRYLLNGWRLSDSDPDPIPDPYGNWWVPIQVRRPEGRVVPTQLSPLHFDFARDAR